MPYNTRVFSYLLDYAYAYYQSKSSYVQCTKEMDLPIASRGSGRSATKEKGSVSPLSDSGKSFRGGI